MNRKNTGCVMGIIVIIALVYIIAVIAHRLNDRVFGRDESRHEEVSMQVSPFHNENKIELV